MEMESQKINEELPIATKAFEDIVKPKKLCDINHQDGLMTSSIVSVTSSLTSPVDSGVQLLDSESEITSLMSMSGIGCDIDNAAHGDDEEINKASIVRTSSKDKQTDVIQQYDTSCIDDDDNTSESCYVRDNKINSELLEGINESNLSYNTAEHHKDEEVQEVKIDKNNSSNLLTVDPQNKSKVHIMTKSDIDNHNTHQYDINTSPAILPVALTANPLNSFSPKHLDNKGNVKYSRQAQKPQIQTKLSDEVFELEPVLINDKKKSENADDLMNISLTSYELLDYTQQNTNSKQNINAGDDMHVSMSEEVNESLKIIVPVEQHEHVDAQLEKQIINTTNDDQIVFRRQRRKKSKSDTPKKRVSFHEDILNSTKIDDIHINHGFITHEPDISMSFFERGFTRKPDVVKGRYSWAAEGDTPYYQKIVPEREVKSDIYIHQARFSSTSSSSSASISSSIDEEEARNGGSSNSDESFIKKEPTQKLPKSSCLKKTKNSKKYIDTNIVQEETNLKKKKSETNLLDSNIFGSLKNIFSFSTSVPLAERGVPEGQEDVTVYSTSDTGIQKQRKYSGSEFSVPKNFDGYEVQPAPVKKIGNLNLELTKTNLKLTKSEGFYPNYPNNQALPTNIIVCDSNVYEHKGISYSYEYEKFQKTFEQQNKPKSSTVYQMLINELNFFKRKEKKAIEKEAKDNFEILNASTPIKDTKPDESEDDKSITNSIKKYASSATIDFSDSETNWDFTDTNHTRHLNSPKRKRNRGSSYSGPSLKIDNNDEKSDSESQLTSAKSLQNIKPSSSKTSLINRFLRNVTMKKIMDLKLQKKQKTSRKYMKLYVTGAKPNTEMSKQLDVQIEREIVEARERKIDVTENYNTHLLYRFKNDIFRSFSEELVRANIQRKIQLTIAQQQMASGPSIGPRGVRYWNLACARIRIPTELPGHLKTVFPVFSAYTTSGENKPLMVVLSNTTLYITGFKPNNSYCNHFVLPYTELNTILIGPNAQTIHLSNYDNDMQCIVTTGSENLTNELIGQLEMAVRKDINKPKLPAVKQLTMRDMVNLRKTICKQTTVTNDEEYFHYSIVNIQDYNSDISETPLGPSKEGPLMFKTAEIDSRWETAYFILKAGILYMLSSPSHRLPMRVLPLINGACQGARRVYNCTRPHTFQVQVGTVTLHLAAPDEYVASEWLQALVHAASKTYSHREKMPAQSCSLLMTSDHILTVREAFPCTLSSSLGLREAHEPIKGAQALSCAAIADITAFRLPCAEQSWCIVEFACREVHESSGDWILYFATNAELEKFISTLEMLWAYHNEQGDCFPLSTIPETDALSRKCIDTYHMIQNTWLSLQMNLQSF